MEARTMLSGLSVFNSQYWHQDQPIQDVGEELDQFGWAVATGDFDGDDFLDLAVGVPGESVSGSAGSGAVNVIYGGRNGLVVTDNQFWTQLDLTGTVDANANVGAALSAGDFNGDGLDDLAIGIPNATIDNQSEAGGVAILYGVRNVGLTTTSQQFWHQNVSGLKGESNPGDHFGTSLAAGDFNGDQIADLAIGVPDDTINGKSEAGGVAVIYGSRSLGLDTPNDQYWHQDIDEAAGTVNGAAEAGDHFGASLAAGDFDGNGVSDLAIGVPDEEINNQARAGGINVVYGTRTGGLAIPGNQFWHQDVADILDDAEVGDGFGAALVAGNFDANRFDDLAIGVPGETLNGLDAAGAVQVLAGANGGLASQGNQLWNQDSVGIAETAEPNDRFGAALASGDFQGNDDVDELIVGAPGESLGGAASVGVVSMLPGTREGLTGVASQTWRPSDLGLTEHADEQFGASLAGGDFDQNRFLDLAIGIPRDRPLSVRSGAVAVMYGALDTTAPSVTINQAPQQADPTSEDTIYFSVIFSEPVTGFTDDDVTLGGTAGAALAEVTGSGASYQVAVFGMTGFGTVTASIPAGVAVDTEGNPNSASVSTDNSVTFQDPLDDLVAVTVNQATNQADPTSGREIKFAVQFSEPVSGFTASDVTLGGSAGATIVNVSGSGATYELTVTGMTQNGTVTASIPGDVVTPENAPSRSVDNVVSYEVSSSLSVTINQAADQEDPTGSPTIHFTVTFSQPVVGFTEAAVAIQGTANPTTAVVTGSGANYTVAVSGMLGSGTVLAFIPAGVVADSEGNLNRISTSTDNTVTYEAPTTVTIEQASDQVDPTNDTEIRFAVRFSERVTEFTAEDVEIGGTAGATSATVTGSGASYQVSISGMQRDGTVTASIPANVVLPLNEASTSTDNTVLYATEPPPIGWTNLRNPLDVNNDGFVSPIDVLRIVNEINSPTVSDAVGKLNPIDTAAPNPPGYLDVTGDGFVSPRDALTIIVYINDNPVLAAAFVLNQDLNQDSDDDEDEAEAE